jgi:hypothetical protein
MNSSNSRPRPVEEQRKRLATQVSRWRSTGDWVCLADLADWRADAGADGIRRVHHGCQQVKLAILDHRAKIARDASMLIIANGAKEETTTATDLEQIEASPQYQLPEGLDTMMYLLTQCWMRRSAIIDLAKACKWQGVQQFLDQLIANAKRNSPSRIQGRLKQDIVRILQEPGAVACVNGTEEVEYVRRRLNELGYKKKEGNLKRTIQRAKSGMKKVASLE